MLAAADLTRAAGLSAGASFGWHRFTLARLAWGLAGEDLARRGLVPVGALAAEAVCARVVHVAAARGRLGRFASLADRPGLPRALARSFSEMRLEGLRPGDITDADLAILLGDYDEALECCQQALDLLRDLGDRFGQAATLDSLGYIHHRLGHHPRAIDYYQQARRLFSDLGDRYNEAGTLSGLGDTHLAGGDTDAARACWQQARAILADLGHHPDADAVRDKLSQIPS